MDKNQLISGLDRVERIASASKVARMMNNPIKYFYAIFSREYFFKLKRQSSQAIARTFFDETMAVLLPSGADIYLTGGKSHPSEIRLAKFLIQNLHSGDTFADAGAHYGYFSLLAARLVGPTGRVVAVEASPSTFRVLEKNTAGKKSITAINKALSDEKAELSFFEFPNLYSEYNTFDISQFKDQSWIEKYPPSEIMVHAEALDDMLEALELNPAIVKVDVEGAEYRVIKGARKLLEKRRPMVVMEYLPDRRGNAAHIQAEALLNELGYLAHAISPLGTLIPIGNAAAYLRKQEADSDNVVFVKAN